VPIRFPFFFAPNANEGHPVELFFNAKRVRSR
jgi:hypothetical protein